MTAASLSFQASGGMIGRGTSARARAGQGAAPASARRAPSGRISTVTDQISIRVREPADGGLDPCCRGGSLHQVGQPDEARHERRCRAAVNFLRRARLLDAACLHYHQAVSR